MRSTSSPSSNRLAIKLCLSWWTCASLHSSKHTWLNLTHLGKGFFLLPVSNRLNFPLSATIKEEGSFRKDRGKWVMSNLHRSPFPAPLMNHCVTESHAVGFSIYWWKSLWWFEFKSLEEVTSTTLESAVTSVSAKSTSVTFVLFWKLRVMVGVLTSDNLGPGG